MCSSRKEGLRALTRVMRRGFLGEEAFCSQVLRGRRDSEGKGGKGSSKIHAEEASCLRHS